MGVFCDNLPLLLSVIKDKPFTRQQNYTFVETESSENFNVAQMVQFFSEKKEKKHCGKRRKFWSPAFSPFLTIFSKSFFLRVVKTGNSLEKLFTTQQSISPPPPPPQKKKKKKKSTLFDKLHFVKTFHLLLIGKCRGKRRKCWL